MSTADERLEMLKAKKRIYLSGEEPEKKFSVSENAVWKNIKTSCRGRYNIETVAAGDRCFLPSSDILSVRDIKSYLNEENKNINIEFLESVDSTNIEVRKRADRREKDGYVLIAGSQTAGRGRYGRSFFSPRSTGLYLSILLKPDKWQSEDALKITAMAAVAACETINELSEKRARIKWVNDIFVEGKKVCGILTQAFFDAVRGKLSYAVLGIGINVYAPYGGFPDEIKDIAGALFESARENIKNRIAATFINRFMCYYRSASHEEYIEKYRRFSLVIGKWVTVISENENIKAFVAGIDNKCRLRVRFPDGEEKCLFYGEISIKT